MAEDENQENKELEKPPIKAVIFDLDGLLIDSEPLWSEARNQILSTFGARVTPEDKKYIMGRDYKESVEYTINKYHVPFSPDEFIRQEQQILDKLYAEKLEFMPGAFRLIKQVDDAGLIKGIATSAPRKRLELSFKKLEIRGFKVKVSGDDISQGKPDPEIFITTAAKMGVEPKNCVVLEDSRQGIMAARAAGMRSVAVIDERYSSPEDFRDDAKPDLLVTSLTDLTVEHILKLSR